MCNNRYVKTVIVTAFDENYWKPSMVALKSFDVNCSQKLDAICLVPENMLTLEEKYRQEINAKSLNVRFRSSSRYRQMTENGVLAGVNYITEIANHRLFLGSLLPEYDKAIYLDADTVTMRDVSPLLNFPMNNKLMAVVEYSNMNQITFNDRDRPYFNAGMFIADLNYWRESNAEDKMLDWVRENGTTIGLDQDAMNAVFFDVLFPLPVSFNTYEFKLLLDKHFAGENEYPLILHFVGPTKPWAEDKRDTRWSQAWQMYADML